MFIWGWVFNIGYLVWGVFDYVSVPEMWKTFFMYRVAAVLDRVQLKLNLRDAGFGVGRKAGTRRNSKAISRASNTASGFEDKSQQISLS